MRGGGAPSGGAVARLGARSKAISAILISCIYLFAETVGREDLVKSRTEMCDRSAASLVGCEVRCGARRVTIMGEILGRGGFATVHVASEKDSPTLYAAKVVDRRSSSDWALGKLQSEIETLELAQAHARHPSIVRFYGAAVCSPFHVLCFEALGPDCLELVLEDKGLGEQRGATIVWQLLNALSHLQLYRICHGCTTSQRMREPSRSARALRPASLSLTTVQTAPHPLPPVLQGHQARESALRSAPGHPADSPRRLRVPPPPSSRPVRAPSIITPPPPPPPAPAWCAQLGTSAPRVRHGFGRHSRAGHHPLLPAGGAADAGLLVRRRHVGDRSEAASG